MNCREFKEHTDGIIEGTTKPGGEMEAHAKECASCRKELMAAIALKEAFSNAEKTRMPADFNSKVWKKIGTPSPSLLDRIFGARPDVDLAFKGAAAAAAVIFIIFMARGTFVKNEAVAALKPSLKQDIKTARSAGINRCASKAAQKNCASIAAAPVEKVKPAVNENLSPARELAIVPADRQEKQDNGPGKGETRPDSHMTVAFGNAPKTGGQEPGAAKPAASSMSSAAFTPKETPTAVDIKTAGSGEPVEIMSNVFNPLHGGSMKIKYSVKNGSDVRLIVYSRNGEIVKTLFSGFRQPGSYEQDWNGTDDNGVVTGADIYFVYVKTDLVEKKVKAAVVK